MTLSGDGHVAAVVTSARLSARDRNVVEDVYTHDLRSGRTTLVSFGYGRGEVIAPPPSVEPSLSHDGRAIAFTSGEGDPNRAEVSPWASQVWWRDMRHPRPRLISTPATGPADDSSSGAAISADGTHVAFASAAANLVPFDDNQEPDAFVLDLEH